MAEYVLQIGSGVATVTAGEHHELGVEGFAVLELHDNGSGNSFGILLIVRFSSVLKCALFHELASVWVEYCLVAVILGFQHQQLPNFIEILERFEFAADAAGLEGLSQNGTDDVHHRVISGLPGCRVFLGWVANDTKCWFVSDDLNVLDVVDPRLSNELRLVDQLLQTLQGSG